MQDEYRKWLDTEYKPIGGGSPEGDPEGEGEGSGEGAGTGGEGEGESQGQGPDARQALDRVNRENRELKQRMATAEQTNQNLQAQLVSLAQKAQNGDAEGAKDDLEGLEETLGSDAVSKLRKAIRGRESISASQVRQMIQESLAPFGTQAVNAELESIKAHPLYGNVSEQMEERLSGLKAINYDLKPGDIKILFKEYLGDAMLTGKVSSAKSGDGVELEGVLSASHNSPGASRKSSVKMTPEMEQFGERLGLTDPVAIMDVWKHKQTVDKKVAEKQSRPREKILKR